MIPSTTSSSKNILVVLAMCLASLTTQSTAFMSRTTNTAPSTVLSQRFSTVIDAPSKQDVSREQELLGNPDENLDDAIRRQGPLEYLEDDLMESREPDDPFHILLLDQTYAKPKITIPYVVQSLEYVLEMPMTDAEDHAQFCHDNGMSCLGTWSREECLDLGKQLQIRDLVCRVVPFAEGGQRPWQASKDASDSSNLRDANADFN